jgi:hypothetical protein
MEAGESRVRRGRVEPIQVSRLRGIPSVHQPGAGSDFQEGSLGERAAPGNARKCKGLKD